MSNIIILVLNHNTQHELVSNENLRDLQKKYNNKFVVHNKTQHKNSFVHVFCFIAFFQTTCYEP